MVGANESKEMAEDVEEAEIQMLIRFRHQVLSPYDEMSRLSNVKWPSTVRSRSLLVLLEAS